ncbi:MAG: NAD-dependent epimerase/dehydratase family protein, partial [Vicinamibacterales bacterium]
MKVVIAGGSGFLGRPLAEIYAEEGHQVTNLTRRLAPAASEYEAGTGLPGITHVGWTPDGSTGPWAAAIDGADLVVNLAGESIAARRWSPEQKRKIRESRISATRSLVAAIRGAARPPAALISGSAVGYYGPRGDESVTERDGPGGDFLAETAAAWEHEARGAEDAGARVAVV